MRKLTRLTAVGAAVLLATTGGIALAATNPGDVNGDGTVNFDDVKALSAARPTDTELADIVANWQKTYPPPAPATFDPVPVTWGEPSGYDASATSLPVPIPAGAANDVLYLTVSTRSDGTITTPAGWTVVSAPSTGGSVDIAVFTRTAPDASAGSVTVPVTAGTSSVGLVARVPTGTTVAASTSGNDTTVGTGYSATGTSISLAVNQRLVALTGFNNDCATFAPTVDETGTADVDTSVAGPLARSRIGLDMALATTSANTLTAGSAVPTATGLCDGGQTGSGRTIFLVLSLPSTGTPPPPSGGPTAGMTVAFGDEFNTLELGVGKRWGYKTSSYEFGDRNPNNFKRDWITPTAMKIENGELVITATPRDSFYWNTGLLTTEPSMGTGGDGFRVQAGDFVVTRVMLPVGNTGAWPGYWTWDGPDGEIDYFEWHSDNPNLLEFTNHIGATDPNYYHTDPAVVAPGKYVWIGTKMGATSNTWYVGTTLENMQPIWSDGTGVGTTKPYLITNLSLNGGPYHSQPSGTEPITYRVDNVRVYR